MDPGKSTTLVAYLTSLSGGVTALTVNQWIAIGHLVIAVLTFSVNLIYKRRKARMEKQALAQREGTR